MPATTGNPPAQLRQRQLLLIRQVTEQLLAAALPAVGQWQRRQRPVQRVLGQVEITQHAPQQGHAHLGLDQRLERLEFRLCLSLGWPHHHKHAGHDFQRVGLTPIAAQPPFKVGIKRLRIGQRRLRGEHHVGGLRSLVDHGRTGYLVEEPDPEAYAAWIRQILAEPLLAERLRSGSVMRARRYTWARAARLLVDIYADLTTGRLVECR